jgi:hypothetical protein
MMRRKTRFILRTETTLKFTLLLLILTLASLSAHSKVIREESSDDKFSACIELIYHHPITLIHYPNFHLRKELKDEVNEYCHCQFQQERRIRIGEKIQSKLDWAFRDPTQQLNSKDKCSLEKLEVFSNETLYAIFYATQIAPFIQDQLKDRYKQATRIIASESSVENKLNCLSQNIFKKCGKIKSLQVTYQCVNKNLKDLEFIQQMENQCPEFSPEEIITSADQPDYI